jgi:hypothetical protein
MPEFEMTCSTWRNLILKGFEALETFKTETNNRNSPSKEKIGPAIK